VAGRADGSIVSSYSLLWPALMRAGSVPYWSRFDRGAGMQTSENFVQSVDYNISQRDQLRALLYNKLDKVDQSANLSGFYTVQPFRFHLFTLGESIPSPLDHQRVPRGFNRLFNHYA